MYAALAPVRVYGAMLGAAASLPNSFAHLHAHVIPVFERDERARPANVFSWSAGVALYSDPEAAALRETLRAHWRREGSVRREAPSGPLEVE